MSSPEIETLHEPFKLFLRAQGIPFVNPRSDRESTVDVGHPDFSIFFNGHVIFIEWKSKEGRVSGDQRARIEVLERAGNKVFVLRDLQAGIEIVNAWRATLGEVRDFTAKPEPGKDDGLRRFGHAVVKRDAAGRWAHVRVAGPGDEGILPVSARRLTSGGACAGGWQSRP